MDLNEKLAARRRELAIEAETARLAEQSAISEANEQARLESEQIKKEKEEELYTEIWRRSERFSHDTSTHVAARRAMTNTEFKEALQTAALSRMTILERLFLFTLAIFTIWGFFVFPLVGVVFLILTFIDLKMVESKHKAQILAEREFRVRPRRAQ